jgi:hypothetical protein
MVRCEEDSDEQDDETGEGELEVAGFIGDVGHDFSP